MQQPVQTSVGWDGRAERFGALPELHSGRRGCLCARRCKQAQRQSRGVTFEATVQQGASSGLTTKKAVKTEESLIQNFLVSK